MKEVLIDAVMGDMTDQQRRAVWRTAFIAILGLHIFWACGWLPGVSGFAMASDFKLIKNEVEILKDEVGDIRTALLVKDIETAQQRICEAQKANNTKALRYAAERKTELTRRFVESEGRNPVIPSCAELGIILEIEQ